MRLTLAALPFAALLLPGCLAGRDVTVSDGMEFSLFQPAGDNLSLPWVEGTTVNFLVESGRRRDATGWIVRSSAPEVVAVTEIEPGDEAVEAELLAFTAGFATLEVVDAEGEIVRSVDVEVAAPDHIELRPAALAYGEVFDRPVTLDDLRVAVGGDAAFLVSYFAGDREVFGNGVLVVEADSALGARADQTFLAANRDWVHLAPTEAASGDLRLTAGSLASATVAVHAVGPDALDHLVIIDSPDDEAATVEAFAADGAQVWGVDASWRFDGHRLGEGDVVTYDRSARHCEEAEVTLDTLRATAEICARNMDVESASSLGCATAPTGLLGAPAGLLGALVALRRRRR